MAGGGVIHGLVARFVFSLSCGAGRGGAPRGRGGEQVAM